MGFISTGDSYSFRGDVAIDGLPVHKVIDDMGMGSPKFNQLIGLLCETLERCAKHGLTINKKKSVLCSRAIDFVGYRVSENSIEVDKKKTSAIAEFPTPTTRTDLRSFLGLVNQLGGFSKEVARVTKPLRDLLKTRNKFKWLPDHDEAFKEAWRALTSAPVLAMFDKDAETCLQTDASRRFGLGFALLQRQSGTEKWRLIQCGSRFLQDAETRYAMVELEALAIQWAIKKCHVFLAGLPHFSVITDHKSLESLFNKYNLDAIDNPRVQNYRMKLLNYSFKVVWRKGKEHSIPDALSRAPVSDPEPEDKAGTIQVGAIVAHSVRRVCEDLLIQNLEAQAREDEDYKKLITAVIHGRFDGESDYVRRFVPIQDELSVQDDLVLRGCRIVIPPIIVKDVVKRLHASRQGIDKTRRRARQSWPVYWPGFSVDIKSTVDNCLQCQRLRPAPEAEPLIQEEEPSRPFEVATSDLFEHGGKQYLIYADRYSGYPLVEKFNSAPSSSDLTKTFRKFFSTMGVPNILRSDNGPQYRSKETQDFLKQWSVIWKPSSPHHHQSNGHAEVTVKIMKNLLIKSGGKIESDDFNAGLLELRNSPRADGLSPSQRLFGAPLRSQVPAHWRSFEKKWQVNADQADRKRLKSKAKRKFYYDRLTRKREDLKPGSHVIVQDPVTGKWDKFAMVVGAPDRRRYHLRFPSGRVLWRNKKFLRHVPAQLVNEEDDHLPGERPEESFEGPKRGLRKRKQPDRLQVK